MIYSFSLAVWQEKEPRSPGPSPSSFSHRSLTHPQLLQPSHQTISQGMTVEYCIRLCSQQQACESSGKDFRISIKTAPDLLPQSPAPGFCHRAAAGSYRWQSGLKMEPSPAPIRYFPRGKQCLKSWIPSEPLRTVCCEFHLFHSLQISPAEFCLSWNFLPLFCISNLTLYHSKARFFFP